ncbi:hypothetical protein RHMOL_Rhmol01G0370800 [Rhododendron molle]|uniref:Uncharacterized protein n=1 Tax=Rhododendron molle TaxID=49168 RepID=A0ACC0Q9E8_RHOML|nr:hypothetical protein RHMOL_Rhmol01G0370800 [Rhododendron molle]
MNNSRSSVAEMRSESSDARSDGPKVHSMVLRMYTTPTRSPTFSYVGGGFKPCVGFGDLRSHILGLQWSFFVFYVYICK